MKWYEVVAVLWFVWGWVVVVYATFALQRIGKRVRPVSLTFLFLFWPVLFVAYVVRCVRLEYRGEWRRKW